MSDSTDCLDRDEHEVVWQWLGLIDEKVSDLVNYLGMLLKKDRAKLAAIRAYANELDEGAKADLVTIRESSTMNRIAAELRALPDGEEKR